MSLSTDSFCLSLDSFRQTNNSNALQRMVSKQTSKIFVLLLVFMFAFGELSGISTSERFVIAEWLDADQDLLQLVLLRQSYPIEVWTQSKRNEQRKKCYSLHVYGIILRIQFFSKSIFISWPYFCFPSSFKHLHMNFERNLNENISSVSRACWSLTDGNESITL